MILGLGPRGPGFNSRSSPFALPASFVGKLALPRRARVAQEAEQAAPRAPQAERIAKEGVQRREVVRALGGFDAKRPELATSLRENLGFVSW